MKNNKNTVLTILEVFTWLALVANIFTALSFGLNLFLGKEQLFMGLPGLRPDTNLLPLKNTNHFFPLVVLLFLIIILKVYFFYLLSKGFKLFNTQSDFNENFSTILKNSALTAFLIFIVTFIGVSYFTYLKSLLKTEEILNIASYLRSNAGFLLSGGILYVFALVVGKAVINK